jgi:hypothetical protein
LLNLKICLVSVFIGTVKILYFNFGGTDMFMMCHFLTQK